jgi:hypothetical protein
MNEHDNPTPADENFQRYLASRMYWKIRNRISRKPNLTSEEEALRNIHSGLSSLKLRITDKPISTKSLLRLAGIKNIFDKSGNKIWLKDADAEDLERFCLDKFSALGLELPEDYYNRK